MENNFTKYAYTESVKKMQSAFGVREFNEILEKKEPLSELGAGEIEFITTRSDFYLSTSGENGWPYVQHKGGPQVFLKVINSETIDFAVWSKL